MKKFKGIYKGSELSNEAYHAEKEHLSSSNLKMLLKDPAQFYDEKILGNRIVKELAVFAEGSLVHSLILEPHLVDEEFVCFPEFRKFGKKWDAFKAAEKSGKNRTILSKPQWKRCELLVKTFEKNSTAVELVKQCDTELSLFLELDGVPCKVRGDCVDIENGIIADLKTTGYDTDPDSFTFTVKDFEYDLSAVFYCMVFEAHYGRSFDFFWIPIGKKDGKCEVYKMSKETRAKGERKVMKALKLFKECKESGIWEAKAVDKFGLKCYDDYEIKEI